MSELREFTMTLQIADDGPCRVEVSEKGRRTAKGVMETPLGGMLGVRECLMNGGNLVRSLYRTQERAQLVSQRAQEVERRRREREQHRAEAVAANGTQPDLFFDDSALQAEVARIAAARTTPQMQKLEAGAVLAVEAGLISPEDASRALRDAAVRIGSESDNDNDIPVEGDGETTCVECGQPLDGPEGQRYCTNKACPQFLPKKDRPQSHEQVV